MPELRDAGFADRACRWCGHSFFTTGGLRDHQMQCIERPGISESERERLRAQLAAQAEVRKAQAGRAANRRLFRCDECGLVSISGSIGSHQRHSGHTGRTEVAD